MRIALIALSLLTSLLTACDPKPAEPPPPTTAPAETNPQTPPAKNSDEDSPLKSGY